MYILHNTSNIMYDKSVLTSHRYFVQLNKEKNTNSRCLY